MREQDREVFERARRFVYRNARPLDLARWKYHFENGSEQEVLAALSAYQNEDGGFGHGLEEDNMKPHSIPMQAWRATVALRELEGLHKSEAIVQKLLGYLARTSEFDGEKWSYVVASNNDFPHASWWTYSHASWYQDTEKERFIRRYNPTASLAGFILRYGDVDSDFWQKALGIAKESVEALFQLGDPQDMHVLSCFVQLWEDIGAAGLSGSFDMDRLTALLQELVSATITQDISKWETDYICKPSQFFNRKESVFYDRNREVAQYECAFVRKTQMSDGSYAVNWSWDDYPDAWAVSRNWWSAEITVNNMIYLNNMGQEE